SPVTSDPYPLSLHDALPISSMSLGSRPALSSAGCTASRIICSRSSLSSLPKGVWPQPMMYELLMSILCKDVEGNQCASGCAATRSEEHTSELQSRSDLVCRL